MVMIASSTAEPLDLVNSREIGHGPLDQVIKLFDLNQRLVANKIAPLP